MHNRALLALLTLDGLVTLVFEVLFLPSYLGAVAFPITAVVAMIVNPLLILGARTATDRTGLTALPLLAWVLGLLVCASGGPGGDVMLPLTWPTLLLFVLGIVPAVGMLYRGAFLRAIR